MITGLWFVYLSTGAGGTWVTRPSSYSVCGVLLHPALWRVTGCLFYGFGVVVTVGCMVNSLECWIPFLAKIGLANFLPPPSHGTQTIISCFLGDKFITQFIGLEKEAAINNTPSAIAVASINDWIQLLITCRRDPHLAKASIEVFFRQLFDIHTGDEQDLEFYNKNLPNIVNKLLLVNNLPLISLPSQIASVPNILVVDFDDLDSADKEAITSLLESLSSSIEDSSNSFSEFASYIPILPPRQLELDSIDLDHKLWGFNTMNFRAPFTQETLITLLSLSSDAVDQCKVLVWQGKQFLAAELEYNLLIFSLQSFDQSKCSNNQVFFRSKAIPQDRNNLKRYLKTCWNIKRPFFDHLLSWILPSPRSGRIKGSRLMDPAQLSPPKDRCVDQKNTMTLEKPQDCSLSMTKVCQSIVTNEFDVKSLVSVKKSTKRFIHIVFCSRAFEFIKPCDVFGKIIRDYYLEKLKLFENFGFSWTYTSNLASWLYKPTETFLKPLNTFEKCICESHKRFTPFLDSSFLNSSHVLTTDTSICHHPKLRAFLSKGLNHIPPLPPNPYAIVDALFDGWKKLCEFLPFPLNQTIKI
ncbi:hypothetical protein L7F22_024862 [Adiantum nelumboides]|nr:hypothetical protein [Adiantum nelumboides]